MVGINIIYSSGNIFPTGIIFPFFSPRMTSESAHPSPSNHGIGMSTTPHQLPISTVFTSD